MESAWARVKDCVRMRECKYVFGMFMDFKGDNLEQMRGIEKLHKIGYEKMSLWRGYIQQTRTRMIGVNEVVWKNVGRDCPQRSICGLIHLEPNDGWASVKAERLGTSMLHMRMICYCLWMDRSEWKLSERALTG